MASLGHNELTHCSENAWWNSYVVYIGYTFNVLRVRQNGDHFAHSIFKFKLLWWNYWNSSIVHITYIFLKLRLRLNTSLFPNIFKLTSFYEICCVFTKILLKFVPKAPINIRPSLVQIMAWHPTSDMPLSAPMMVKILTITQPEWIKSFF